MTGRRAFLAGGSALAGAALFGAGPASPQVRRLVTVGGDVTEIVHALGLGPSVVAVDTTSTWPASTARLPKVGYLRQLGAEGVLALRPTALVVGGDAGPPSTLAQLRSAGLAVVQARSARSPAEVQANIAAIGRALGRAGEAEALNRGFGERWRRAQAQVAGLRGRPRALFLLSVGSGSPNAGGRDTAADAAIRLAGGVNAAGHEGYKALSLEAAAAARPDVILMMGNVLAGAGGPARVAAQPALRLTPAGRAGRVVALDPLLHLGFGPRTPEGVADLARRMRA